VGFWRSLERQHVKPLLRHLRPWRRRRFGSVRVHYMKHLDGGGSGFGQEYILYLQSRGMPPQSRVYEWCAGPAFIGFSLLGHGLAETLCLADVNPQAVEACRRTIGDNGLADRVAVYHSDSLRDIPASEQWDLVVSNPPHFVDDHIGDLRAHDADWHLHRAFYANVTKHLKPGGVIVLQENNRGSTAETFRPMIEQAGLRIIFVDRCAPQRTAHDAFYFVGVMRAAETPPRWARA
jgi:methylase of polypeptide subunit release factors